MRLIKAFARIFVTFVWTLLLLPLQYVSIALGGARNSERVPRLYHAGLCRILGIEINVVGIPVAHRPALFVANHSSCLDILVLGGLVDGYFVAKAEVAHWPGWVLWPAFSGWNLSNARVARLERMCVNFNSGLRAVHA